MVKEVDRAEEVAVKEDVGNRLTIESLRASGTNKKDPKAAEGGSLSQGTLVIPNPMMCNICENQDNHRSEMCLELDFKWQRHNADFIVRVSNISKDTREQDLDDLFYPFGPLYKVYIDVTSVSSSNNRFVGFVYFIDSEDAKRAAIKLDGYEYDKHILKVEWPIPIHTPNTTGGDFLRTHLSIMKCQTCGKKDDHFTPCFPYKDHTEDELNIYIPPCCQRTIPLVEIMVKVSNLSKDTKEQELHDLFSPFDHLRRVHIAVKEKKNKGFGFVEFVCKEDGERAINKLDGYSYYDDDKHILKVKRAESKFVGYGWIVSCPDHSTI